MISVVIPVYNDPRVEEAIASAWEQPEVSEVIVVDDGSVPPVTLAPGTWATVLRQPNQGQAVARNVGVDAARGDWIAFLDADDLWLPGKLAKQLRVALHTGADLVYTAATVPKAGGKEDIWGARVSGSREEEDVQGVKAVAYAPGEIWEDCCLGNLLLCPSSWLVRREAFLAMGGFDPSIAGTEDRDFAARFTRFFAVTYIDEPLMVYRAPDGFPEISIRRKLTRAMLRLAEKQPEPLATKARVFALVWGGLLELAGGAPELAIAHLLQAQSLDDGFFKRFREQIDPWREHYSAGALGIALAVGFGDRIEGYADALQALPGPLAEFGAQASQLVRGSADEYWD